MMTSKEAHNETEFCNDSNIAALKF